MFGPLVLGLLRSLVSGVCHQLPARSLRAAGTVLPLCARCTGTYLGTLLGLGTIILRRRARASLLPRWPVLTLSAAIFLAWAIDGLNSYLTLLPGFPHLYEPQNTLRLLTGTLQGLALILAIWPVVGFTLWRDPRREQVVSLQEFVTLLLAAILLVAILSQPWPGPLYAAGVLSFLGLLSLFCLLNLLVLVVALRREGTAQSLRQLIPLLLAALTLSGLELTLLGLLRRWAGA